MVPADSFELGIAAGLRDVRYIRAIAKILPDCQIIHIILNRGLRPGGKGT